MRDKRPVDELSIEELERILAIRKRERRQQQLRRLSKEGRRVVPPSTALAGSPPAVADAPAAQPVSAGSDSAPVVAGTALPAAQEAPQPVADDGLPRFEDDQQPLTLHESTPVPQATAEPTLFERVWNRTLLLVEVLAFVGIVVIGTQMIQALQTLRTETAAVQAEAQAAAFAGLSTPTVTPEISLNRIVLPSGHTPPTDPGGAQFNLNEIPENLRPVVQQQLAAPIVIPTPAPESPTRIEVPRLGIDAPVISGTSWEALKRGVGHMENTGLPGRSGNMVLSAHNDIYGEIFRYLDRLQPGDEIIVHTTTRTYTYVIRETQIVSPYAVRVLDGTREPTATLISCYPYQVDNQRIVVFADLVQS